MLPGPSRAIERALRLCQSIFWCFRKLHQSWRCIQDAPRFDLKGSQISKQRRSQCNTVRDFVSSWNRCAALQATSYHILTAVALWNL
jgi:hypothetical protein